MHSPVAPLHPLETRRLRASRCAAPPAAALAAALLLVAFLAAPLLLTALGTPGAQAAFLGLFL